MLRRGKDIFFLPSHQEWQKHFSKSKDYKSSKHKSMLCVSQKLNKRLCLRSDWFNILQGEQKSVYSQKDKSDESIAKLNTKPINVPQYKDHKE